MKVLLAVFLGLASWAALNEEQADRLPEDATISSEIMAAADTIFPQDLQTYAHCTVVVFGPSTAAFVIGGNGRGYIFWGRASGRGWAWPGTVRIQGGRSGCPESTDLIMLVMSERGAGEPPSSIVTGDAEGSVASGPVGRTVTAQAARRGGSPGGPPYAFRFAYRYF